MSKQTPIIETAEVQPITRVVFRKFKDGGILALMPDSFSDCTHWYSCDSFMLNGGHSGAHPLAMVSETKPATPEEYAATKRTMEADPYNYNLKVLQRIPSECADIRRSAWVAYQNNTK